MAGKKIGKDNIYIHKSAAHTLPTHLKNRMEVAAEKLAKQFTGKPIVIDEGNFIITHPKYIEFVEAEAFDTTYEPVLGKRYRVTDDGEVLFIPRPTKPRILHQRYKTVKKDYTGFDQELDKAREKWYRSHFSRQDMAGAGFQHKWVEMIDRIKGFIEESHRQGGNHAKT
jgi:hypothetical protein